MKKLCLAILLVFLLAGCSTVPNGAGMPSTSLPKPVYELMDLACSAVDIAMLADGKGFDVNKCFVKEFGIWVIDATATGLNSATQSLQKSSNTEPPPERLPEPTYRAKSD
jgi:hypothetical protein